MNVCHCGYGAIGQCVVCARPLCRTHAVSGGHGLIPKGLPDELSWAREIFGAGYWADRPGSAMCESHRLKAAWDKLAAVEATLPDAAVEKDRRLVELGYFVRPSCTLEDLAQWWLDQAASHNIRPSPIPIRREGLLDVGEWYGEDGCNLVKVTAEPGWRFAMGEGRREMYLLADGRFFPPNWHEMESERRSVGGLFTRQRNYRVIRRFPETRGIVGIDLRRFFVAADSMIAAVR